MSFKDINTRIYATDFTLEAQDKAAQIRHLARVGIAASNTEANVRDLGASISALFEVIFRLAEDIEMELDGQEARA